MKFTLDNKKRKGIALGLVAVLGYFTGEFVPPEVFVQLLGGFG